MARIQDPDDGRRFFISPNDLGKVETAKAKQYVFVSRELG